MQFSHGPTCLFQNKTVPVWHFVHLVIVSYCQEAWQSEQYTYHILCEVERSPMFLREVKLLSDGWRRHFNIIRQWSHEPAWFCYVILPTPNWDRYWWWHRVLYIKPISPVKTLCSEFEWSYIAVWTLDSLSTQNTLHNYKPLASVGQNVWKIMEKYITVECIVAISFINLLHFSVM